MGPTLLEPLTFDDLIMAITWLKKLKRGAGAVEGNRHGQIQETRDEHETGRQQTPPWRPDHREERNQVHDIDDADGEDDQEAYTRRAGRRKEQIGFRHNGVSSSGFQPHTLGEPLSIPHLVSGLPPDPGLSTEQISASSRNHSSTSQGPGTAPSFPSVALAAHRRPLMLPNRRPSPQQPDQADPLSVVQGSGELDQRPPQRYSAQTAEAAETGTSARRAALVETREQQTVHSRSLITESIRPRLQALGIEEPTPPPWQARLASPSVCMRCYLAYCACGALSLGLSLFWSIFKQDVNAGFTIGA